MSNGILYLHALTPLHPGSGTSLGVVDLPIQRERHTHWPVLPASSLKGVLRDEFRKTIDQPPREADQDPTIQLLFGPSTIGQEDNGNAHAGSLSVTDARIIAFPVRSLKGVFAWVTCPAVLARFKRDRQLAELTDFPELCEELSNQEAFIAKDSPLLINGDRIVLEEFEYQKRKLDAGELLQWLSQQPFKADEVSEQESKRWVILSDDNFTHFVSHATEVSARIRLDYETKTVKTGALFYEEFLPAETLFYSLLLSEPSHNGNQTSADEVFETFSNGCPSYLQVGGDATIGKGYCAVKIQKGGKING